MFAERAETACANVNRLNDEFVGFYGTHSVFFVRPEIPGRVGIAFRPFRDFLLLIKPAVPVKLTAITNLYGGLSETGYLPNLNQSILSFI